MARKRYFSRPRFRSGGGGTSVRGMLQAFRAGKSAANQTKRKKKGVPVWVWIVGVLAIAGIAFKNKISAMFKKDKMAG